MNARALTHDPVDRHRQCAVLPYALLAGPDVDRGLASVDETATDGLTDALLAVRDRRDRQAFERLFDHFAPRLKAMFLRGGLRDGTAEDLVQDVMLSVWHKALQFDPHRARASAWIYGIARYRRIDLARRKPLPLVEFHDDQPGTEPDAEHLLALRQESELLRQALARLSPDQCATIEQAFVADLTHLQISQATGLPLGTIKSRIRLGLERLRYELKALKP